MEDLGREEFDQLLVLHVERAFHRHVDHDSEPQVQVATKRGGMKPHLQDVETLRVGQLVAREQTAQTTKRFERVVSALETVELASALVDQALFDDTFTKQR